MAQTYFGSTLRAGSGTLTDTVDGGFVVMTQTNTVTTAAAGTATSVTEVLPAGSQIIDIFIDTMVDEVVGGGTATAIAATRPDRRCWRSALLGSRSHGESGHHRVSTTNHRGCDSTIRLG
jgi:hypothetical protein